MVYTVFFFFLPDISRFPTTQRGFQGQTGVSRHLWLFLTPALECNTFSAQAQSYLLTNSFPGACLYPSSDCLHTVEMSPYTSDFPNAGSQSSLSLCPLSSLCLCFWPETQHIGSYGKTRPVFVSGHKED